MPSHPAEAQDRGASHGSCAVVIVSYRTPELAARSAQSALDARAAEVVVIDNASGDLTIQRLRSIANPRLRILTNNVNLGFGVAANRAVSIAAADVLIFLNSDAELTPQATNALLDEVESRNGRAIIGPRLVGSDGVVQRSAGLLPAPTDLAIRATGLHRLARRLGQVFGGRLFTWSRVAREYASSEASVGTIDTTMVSGACFAIGREAFWELGGFDERFFMYFEDADLCKRAAAAGMPIRYVPSAVVTHIGGASSEGDYHFGALHARAMRQYLGKWYGPAGSAFAILLLWLRAVGMTLALRSDAPRAWRAWWAALIDEDPRR